jgi:hypothetical protein
MEAGKGRTPGDEKKEMVGEQMHHLPNPPAHNQQGDIGG